MKEKSNSNLIKSPDDIKLGAPTNSKGKEIKRMKERKKGQKNVCWKQQNQTQPVKQKLIYFEKLSLNTDIQQNTNTKQSCGKEIETEQVWTLIKYN